MQTVDTKQATLSYEKVGPDEGVPLVLIHGFTGHRDDFSSVSHRLALNRPVIAVDLRGHGDSRGRLSEPEYSFQTCVSDLVDLLDILGIEKCDLLGHSMGGMIALRLALSHHHRLRSIILMSTSGSPLEPAGREGLKRGIEFLESSNLVTMQAKLEANAKLRPDPIIEAWGHRYWPHQRRRYAAMDVRAYVEFAREMIEQPALGSALSSISCPVLILIGSKDTPFLKAADELERALPHATRVDLEGAGHHPHEERQDEFLKAMDEQRQNTF